MAKRVLGPLAYADAEVVCPDAVYNCSATDGIERVGHVNLQDAGHGTTGVFIFICAYKKLRG